MIFVIIFLLCFALICQYVVVFGILLTDSFDGKKDEFKRCLIPYYFIYGTIKSIKKKFKDL